MGVVPVRDARRHASISLISALSNLSIQYNLSAISIALAFMDDGHQADPAYPRTASQDSALKALVFAGAITGQLTMGLAGDVLGRRRAMLLTNSFSVLGTLGTALFTWGAPAAMFGIMIACRFLLGVGVGGKYPLAATMSQEEAKAHSSVEVAKAFFWQTPGAMLPYVVALLLILSFGRGNHGAEHLVATSMQFRLVLGLGCVPTVASSLLTYHSTESDDYLAARRTASNNPFRVAAEHPELLGPLAGCGLSWLLYDFIYYGTSFNQVMITDAVFGDADALVDVCWQNIVLSAMGLPGVLLGIGWLWRGSPRMLQA